MTGGDDEAHGLLRQNLFALHALTSLLVEKKVITEAEYKERFDWFKEHFDKLAGYARSLAYREETPKDPPPEMAALMREIQTRLFART